MKVKPYKWYKYYERLKKIEPDPPKNLGPDPHRYALEQLAQTGPKPYARVLFLRDNVERHIPLSWLMRQQVARTAAGTDAVLICFFHHDLSTKPSFRDHNYVRVLEIFEGSGCVNDSNSEDESEDDSDEGFSAEEEKIITALENATEKSAATRTNALHAIAETMSFRYLPDFVEERKMTFIDLAEKAIRRGKGAEQSIGAQIVPMLILHLGEGEEVVQALSPILLQTMQDQANSFDVRSNCCSALALANFLGTDDTGDLVPLMQQLETIFSGSYLKGDNTPSNAGADAAGLHAAALSSWALLLTLIPPRDFVSFYNTGSVPSIDNLMGLLESAHLEIRTTAGEVIAQVLECGRTHDDAFLEDKLPELIDSTKTLVTDSNKCIAKRDRKTQRDTFRDVVRYIEEGISPDVSIRFGTETLCLDTWSAHAQYAALCSVLGPGTNIHLAKNDFLRAILDLGEKIPSILLGMKQPSRYNQKVAKARTVTRTRNRDAKSQQ